MFRAALRSKLGVLKLGLGRVLGGLRLRISSEPRNESRRRPPKKKRRRWPSECFYRNIQLAKSQMAPGWMNIFLALMSIPCQGIF